MLSVNWLIDMLLITRSGLVEENVVEVFRHYGVHLPYRISSPFKKIIIWQYSRFLSTSLCPSSTSGTSSFKDSLLDLYPLIRPQRRPLALSRGTILLAISDLARSILLGGVGRDSPFFWVTYWSKVFIYLDTIPCQNCVRLMCCQQAHSSRLCWLFWTELLVVICGYHEIDIGPLTTPNYFPTAGIQTMLHPVLQDRRILPYVIKDPETYF